MRAGRMKKKEIEAEGEGEGARHGRQKQETAQREWQVKNQIQRGENIRPPTRRLPVNWYKLFGGGGNPEIDTPPW